MDNSYDTKKYDVCLSFAGEDRSYVDAVALILKEHGVRVFYDLFEQDILWGKDLYQHLDHVYRKSASFCVIFISSAYAKKLWTKHELRSAQARAFEENKEYILPARFDDTEIPGLPNTIGYVDLRIMTPGDLAKQIERKLHHSLLDDKKIDGLPDAKSKEEIVQSGHFKKATLKRATLKQAVLKRR